MNTLFVPQSYAIPRGRLKPCHEKHSAQAFLAFFRSAGLSPTSSCLRSIIHLLYIVNGGTGRGKVQGFLKVQINGAAGQGDPTGIRLVSRGPIWRWRLRSAQASRLGTLAGRVRSGREISESHGLSRARKPPSQIPGIGSNRVKSLPKSRRSARFNSTCPNRFHRSGRSS